MGTSLENLPLLICAPLPRFQHSAHGLFLWETPDALMLRRINLPGLNLDQAQEMAQPFSFKE